MGFKRTSEGRVFFQGTEEGQTAKKADFRTLSQNGSPPQATQFQILTLLKALNEKLKDSQADRAKMRAELEAYRQHVDELEHKIGRGSDKTAVSRAERAEKIAEDTFKELKETRKLILEVEDKAEKVDKGMMTLQRQMGQAKAMGEELVKTQAGFEELSKRLEETENRHDDLNQKIEKTSAEQSRILRQIEKVAEDRTRFMRKIERIEETVIQTRDALSAKAMVLLTEQGPVKPDKKASIVQQVTGGAAAAESEPRWQESLLLQAGVAAAVLALGILGGWAVSKIREMPFSMPGTQVTASAPSAEAAIQETAAAEEVDTPAQEFESAETVDSYEAPPEENIDLQPPPTIDLTETDDIGTVDVRDEQKLIEMLESDPDGLAAELNNIEPGNAEEMKLAEKAPPEAVKEEPVKAAPRKPEPPAKEEPKEQNLSKRMKPDPSLPEQAKEIERQAYEGVPEAQHDLAAIYTAGQGGVKQDYKRAAYWFQQAADQGIANARYNLGVLYHQGLGLKPDIKEAIKWYKSAAELGHPEAQYNLGIAYIEGIGVGYDPAKAADNFQRAAQQGIIEAAYNLGLIYENGLLGDPAPDEALHWYKLAADRGSPEAKEALEQLAKTLNIKIEDVNRIADGVKGNKKVDAAPAKEAPKAAPPPAPEKKAAVEPMPQPPPPPPPVVHGNQQELTAQVQEYLMRAGLYPGPADGLSSALTEDAIRSYQSVNNLRINGQVSEDLLVHMLGNDGSGEIHE